MHTTIYCGIKHKKKQGLSKNRKLWQPLFFVLIYVSRDKWDVNLFAIRKTKFSKKYTSAFCDLLCLSNVLQSAIVCPCDERLPYWTFVAMHAMKRSSEPFHAVSLTWAGFIKCHASR